MSVEVMTTRLEEADLDALGAAVRALEGESFATRLANLLGAPVQSAGRVLPSSARKLVAAATEKALYAGLRVALTTIDNKAPPRAQIGLHKGLASLSGAAGGAFGLAATLLELPISTTIILRSIAQIGMTEGEDLSEPKAALACVEVFALGAHRPSGAAIEYFVVRDALAKSVSDAARFLLQQKISNESAPILVRLTAQIAARFGLAVSEKVAAQAIPVLGAIGGAAVNYAFADHFQSVARGHFTVRRLERNYGADAVRFEYGRLRQHFAQTGRLDA
ncbi:MAG TPA: EcsC family protein [Roseiarcus sp.]|nr:EcsC family protein [Roseiarcus sp.]